jgi:glycyl-tRNA synthetase beta chain
MDRPERACSGGGGRLSVPFLLEIGVEEVPDWMIEPALDSLRDLFTAVLAEHRLGGTVASMDATPRRLVLRAEGLLRAQPDETRSVSGPPVSSGAGAAQGFAKKMGVALEQLGKTQTAKGEYWSFEKHVPGRATADVLAEALPGLIPKISFPKTMYWTGKGGPRFIRPIRWIVALLGDDVLPFELAGVRSGNISSGHRLLGAKSLPVTIQDYVEQLRANGVILSAAERRERITSALGPDVVVDEALLKTLVYLTEIPTPIRGGFDPNYLQLPREILVTVMRHHQRYFSVGHDGALAPEFVAVMNTDSDPQGLVRLGNERVLRARFNDARFFWDVDQQRKLADRLEDLRNVTFQAKLGSYYEKVERMVTLLKQIAGVLHLNANMAVRAAQLSKVDLTTEMVKEFTELQGVVGGLYAREQGETAEVWRAIYEHYKPVSMEDSIPSTLTGQAVALADKCDTLRGCFDIGLIPTGSRDPIALRRAAQGVVKILVEGRLKLKLSMLLGDNAHLREFMMDRIRYYFRDVRGFNYDEVNAVLAAGSDDLVDVEQRLEAIRTVRPTEDFEPLAASFKRIQNILKQANFSVSGSVDVNLLEAGPESDLHSEFLRVRDAVFAQRRAGDFAGALANIASIRPRVDLFFDKVLVNAPQERIRHNRLTLLSSLLSEFSTIADFSEIVVTTQ